MLHTKALFLINNDESKILELHVFREDAVGTNHHIYAPRGNILHDSAGFFSLLEAR